MLTHNTTNGQPSVTVSQHAKTGYILLHDTFPTHNFQVIVGDTNAQMGKDKK